MVTVLPRMAAGTEASFGYVNVNWKYTKQYFAPVRHGALFTDCSEIGNRRIQFPFWSFLSSIRSRRR